MFGSLAQHCSLERAECLVQRLPVLSSTMSCVSQPEDLGALISVVGLRAGRASLNKISVGHSC